MPRCMTRCGDHSVDPMTLPSELDPHQRREPNPREKRPLIQVRFRLRSRCPSAPQPRKITLREQTSTAHETKRQFERPSPPKIVFPGPGKAGTTVGVAVQSARRYKIQTDADTALRISSTVIEDAKPMLFSRSGEDGNRLSTTEFIDKLRSMVNVDWSYQPVPGNASSPVTRVDGAAFRTVWVGAEPNEMVRSFVAH